ncbi:MAG: hypothetical protein CVU39_12325 [Chloroflexi bacterium HGW-Chloroflexi-10]|nr:MAG: hypothetical protein CVU39_12325 [Chloroflexi bacterium HGW-Chloroflexi-10]
MLYEVNHIENFYITNTKYWSFYPNMFQTIAEIHLHTFKGFFLSSLGKKFLTEFYKNIYWDNSGMLLVCRKDEEIVGFVAGSLEPAGFYTRILKKRLLFFALYALPALIKQPKIFSRLLSAFRKPGDEPNDPDAAKLMSIAVQEEYQGYGLGKLLVEAFITECKKHGKKIILLETDAVDNDAVNCFYQNMGFQLSKAYQTSEARKMNAYRFNL